MKQPPLFSEHLAKELEKYRGRWVAVSEDRLVGAADSATGAQEQALLKKITDPVIFRVPTRRVGRVRGR